MEETRFLGKSSYQFGGPLRFPRRHDLPMKLQNDCFHPTCAAKFTDSAEQLMSSGKSKNQESFGDSLEATFPLRGPWILWD